MTLEEKERLWAEMRTTDYAGRAIRQMPPERLLRGQYGIFEGSLREHQLRAARRELGEETGPL